jgi:hypothetical protein
MKSETLQNGVFVFKTDAIKGVKTGLRMGDVI